jgi:hypothetical protein
LNTFFSVLNKPPWTEIVDCPNIITILTYKNLKVRKMK